MKGTMISFAWIVTFQKFSSLQNVRCLSLSQLQQLCRVSNLAPFYTLLSALKMAACREQPMPSKVLESVSEHTNGRRSGIAKLTL